MSCVVGATVVQYEAGLWSTGRRNTGDAAWKGLGYWIQCEHLHWSEALHSRQVRNLSVAPSRNSTMQTVPAFLQQMCYVVIYVEPVPGQYLAYRLLVHPSVAGWRH